MRNNIGSCFLVLVLVSGCVYDAAGSSEKRLIHDLLNGYGNRQARPAMEPITAEVTLMLKRIMDVDPIKGTFTFTAWLRNMWTDPSLRWNPEDYDNITSIMLHPSLIWMPDNVIQDLVEPPKLFYDVNVGLFSSGLLYHVPMQQVTVSCVPEDIEAPSCALKYGPWHYQTTQLNLKDNGIDMEFFQHNPMADYKLTSTHAQNHEKTFNCCPGMAFSEIYWIFNFEKQNSVEKESKAMSSNQPTDITLVLLALLVAQVIYRFFGYLN